MSGRPRAVAAACVAAAVVTATAASAAPGSGRCCDHLLLAVTAGPGGARGFATEITVEVVDPGTGPRVTALGVGLSQQGGAIDAVEGGGGPIRLSTTRGAGAVSVGLTGSVSTLSAQPITVQLDVPDLGPGQTAVVLEAFGNLRFGQVSLPPYTLAGGSVRLRLVQDVGTVVGRVGDPRDAGLAADAGPAGAGLQQRDFEAATDVGGAFLTGADGVSTAGWAAPDANTGRWTDAGPGAVGWPSFAGPRGPWHLDWAGADVSATGNPVAYVYLPLHGYWRDFRCRQDCMFPAAVPG